MTASHPAAVQALFAAWRRAVPNAQPYINAIQAGKHGDLAGWLHALDALPRCRPAASSLGRTVSVGSPEQMTDAVRCQLETALRALLPWRKGPFCLFGVYIDAEWRSDMKWARIVPHIDLSGCRVLDAGCGNGYYGWRMLEAGAASVTGVDPSLLFALQHAAVAYYLGDRVGATRNLVLPSRLEDLEVAEPFDAIFSMGVIYHRRDPQAHLRDLARHAHAHTVLVLESLVVDTQPLLPHGRYARMRNVYVVPDISTLLGWLAQAGFGAATVVDVAPTTAREQRATAWMPFQSLAHALHPMDPNRTVEGHAAPKRAVVIARKAA